MESHHVLDRLSQVKGNALIGVLGVAILLLAVATATLGYLYLADRAAFPVDMVVCDSASNSCDVKARYDGLQACQWDAELGNMRCKWSSDKRTASCEAALDAAAIGHCIKR